MDFRTPADQEKFLKFFGPPFKGICCLTLKAAVMTIGIIDIVIGVLCGLELFVIITSNAFFGVEILLGIKDVISVTCIYYAVLGLQGITKVDSAKVESYSKFKTVELIMNIPIRLANYILLCQEFDMCGFDNIIFGLVLHSLVSF